MFKTSLIICKIQIKVQILTKNLILKHFSMYRTIYEHLRYKTFHTRYDTYRIVLTTMGKPSI